MGYTLEAEEIEGSVETILEGIKGFKNAASARIASGDYTETHLLKLNRMQKALLDIEYDLQKL